MLLLLGAQLSELHPGPLRQHLQGAALLCLLDELHEGEDIAGALAAEAIPGLKLGIDLEARAVLLVEGAQAPQVLVALGQTDMLLDNLDQVDLGKGVIRRRLGHTSIVGRSELRHGGGYERLVASGAAGRRSRVVVANSF